MAAGSALAAALCVASAGVAATTPATTPATPGSGPATARVTGMDSGGRTLSFDLSAVRDAAGGGTETLPIDPGSVTIRGSVDAGAPLSVTPAEGGGGTTQALRSVMLLLDTSDSMTTDNRIGAERVAAQSFLDLVRRSAPGTQVGVVTFGDPAVLTVKPTTDYDAVEKAINAIDPAGNTAMFQAVTIAADAMKDGGTRGILMISDGKNEDLTAPKTSKTQAQQALGLNRKVNQIAFSGILVGKEDSDRRDIFDIAGAAKVVNATQSADLAASLTQVVKRGVDAQAKTISVNAPLPPSWAGRQVQLQIGATSGGVPITAASFPWSFDAAAPTSSSPAAAAPVPAPGGGSPSIPFPVVIIGLVALFGGLAVLLSTATGGLAGADDKQSAVIRRLEMYTVGGGGAPTRVAVTEQTTRLGDSALTRSAVGLMTKLARSSQLDRALDTRLEAAGLPLRTAEWMLLHIGISVGSALLLLLLSGGQLAALVVGLLLGLAGPWMFLTAARSRRERRFLAQLPDTLQMLAGSLAAGYSLPQAMDAVVRETGPPISLEFNRALIEARLGLLPEDALDGIAKRTGSTDFSWIVMAIRIQRDVGGNLSELLSSVADTLRERERLRRQVSALSAEGRLSGAILGALPLVFGLYLLLTQPDYIAPLFQTPLGLLMLSGGAVALIVGGFWMSRVIKVKV